MREAERRGVVAWFMDCVWSRVRPAAPPARPGTGDLGAIVYAMSGAEERDREAAAYAAGYDAAKRGLPYDEVRTVFGHMGWRAYHREQNR